MCGDGATALVRSSIRDAKPGYEKKRYVGGQDKITSALRNRMRPFGNVKRDYRRAFAAAQHAVGRDRVGVLHIERDEKAGIDINSQ